jgi:hypothetical protein
MKLHIILTVVFYGCGACYVILREEYRLKVFGKKAQRRIFGLKRDETIAGRRTLHNEEHDLYTSPNIIRMMNSRRMRLTGHVTRMEAKRNAYMILVGKPEGRRPLGRPRRKCVNNVRMDLREIGWGCIDWIHLTRDIEE